MEWSEAQIAAAAAAAADAVAKQTADSEELRAQFASDLALFARHAPAVVELRGVREIAHYYVTSGRNGCNPVKRLERRQAKSIELCSTYSIVNDGTGNRGEYAGTKLIFAADYHGFVMLTRTGTWSKWQGEADEWSTTERVLSPAEVAEECYANKDTIMLAFENAFQAAAQAIEDQGEQG